MLLSPSMSGKCWVLVILRALETRASIWVKRASKVSSLGKMFNSNNFSSSCYLSRLIPYSILFCSTLFCPILIMNNQLSQVLFHWFSSSSPVWPGTSWYLFPGPKSLTIRRCWMEGWSHLPFGEGSSVKRYFVSIKELTSGPKPGSQPLWSHESGCCVYFPVSAKVSLSFLLPATLTLSPTDTLQSTFLQAWCLVGSTSEFWLGLKSVTRLVSGSDWHMRL